MRAGWDAVERGIERIGIQLNNIYVGVEMFALMRHRVKMGACGGSMMTIGSRRKDNRKPVTHGICEHVEFFVGLP